MEFQIKQERTYTTWLTIEANTIEEAEVKYLQMRDEGTTFSEELEQCNVDNEDYTIFKP
jgi:hypothetical protein